MHVVGDAGVSDGGHSGGNGDVTVNDDTNSEYSEVNLGDSGAGDITIKREATIQNGSKYKNVPQRAPKYIIHCGKKSKAQNFQQTMSLHCSCLCYFFTTTIVKKIIVETNVNAGIAWGWFLTQSYSVTLYGKLLVTMVCMQSSILW